MGKKEERREARKKGGKKERKKERKKEKNLKVWVHDGIPFFYINILKSGGWGG